MRKTKTDPLLTITLGLSAAVVELEQARLVILDAIWQLRDIARGKKPEPPRKGKAKR